MKKTIIYLIILVIIAVCSFTGGYISSLTENIKDENINNNTNNENQSSEQDNEQTTTKPQTTELNNSKTPNKSSKSSQKKPATSSSSKEEIRIVYLDVYHRNDCGYCNELLKFLNNLDKETKSHVVIRKHDVTKEYDKFETTVDKYGNNPGYGVPYVVFNNEKALTGYSKNLEQKYKSYINNYIK